MKVIINADDFGMNEKVNGAIVDLLTRQKITSSTLLANAPFIQQACAESQRFPQCSFGVHLNATEFRPISVSPKLAPLLDERGEFIMNKIREVRIDSDLKEGIYEEFSAQVELIKGLGVNISHFDSHNYVTTIPGLFSVLKRVQKRFQVRKVRITRNIYSPDEAAGAAFRLRKNAYNFVLRHYFRTATTSGFSGFDLFHALGTQKDLKHKSFEVVVHPGNDYYAPEELETLEGPWREQLKFPVRLVNYSEL
jgi:predicted glycoside hydrolase/deacetylase ChbG (UPF0249 family)